MGQQFRKFAKERLMELIRIVGFAGITLFSGLRHINIGIHMENLKGSAMNENNLDQSELNREMILDLFYTTNGNLDKINRTIDKKLKIRGFRKITLFEEFVKNRLAVNPHILKMPKMEVSTFETIYLCQYPAINGIKVLDLRKNFIGDEGVEAIAQSPY